MIANMPSPSYLLALRDDWYAVTDRDYDYGEKERAIYHWAQRHSPESSTGATRKVLLFPNYVIKLPRYRGVAHANLFEWWLYSTVQKERPDLAPFFAETHYHRHVIVQERVHLAHEDALNVVTWDAYRSALEIVAEFQTLIRDLHSYNFGFTDSGDLKLTDWGNGAMSPCITSQERRRSWRKALMRFEFSGVGASSYDRSYDPNLDD